MTQYATLVTSLGSIRVRLLPVQSYAPGALSGVTTCRSPTEPRRAVNQKS